MQNDSHTLTAKRCSWHWPSRNLYKTVTCPFPPPVSTKPSISIRELIHTIHKQHLRTHHRTYYHSSSSPVTTIILFAIHSIANAPRSEEKTYFKHNSFVSTAVIQVLEESPLSLTATSSTHKDQTDTDNLPDAETMTLIYKTQLAYTHKEFDNPNTFLGSNSFKWTEVLGKHGWKAVQQNKCGCWSQAG